MTGSRWKQSDDLPKNELPDRFNVAHPPQYVDIGNGRFYTGDCFDVMPTIERQTVNLVLCDLLYATTQNKWDFPTQKPVALFEYLIRTYTNEGDLLLDNCAGSGTTAMACENTGRQWICIEKDEGYARHSHCGTGRQTFTGRLEELSAPRKGSG
jgi:DNA methylase